MAREMRRTPSIDDMPSLRRLGERSSRRHISTFEERRSVPFEADWGATPPPGFVNGLSSPPNKPARPSGGRVNGLRSGRTNGLPGGLVNGLKRGWVYGFTNGTNGHVNGFTNGNRGRTNGLKNGRTNGLKNGRTNGLSNGRINGHPLGRVNGNGRKSGLVNGNGFINGFRLTSAPKNIPMARSETSIRVIMVFAVVALVVILPFLLVYTMPVDVIKIDGYFFDWDRAGYFSEPVGSVPSDIDIRGYSVVVAGSSIYGYVSTSSPMFPQEWNERTSFFIFFETDGNPQTGYIVDGIGADKMVEVTGWNGSLKAGHSAVYDFSSGADRNDFQGFRNGRNVSVMGSANQVEFSFPWVGQGDPVVRFFSKCSTGCEDASEYSISYEKAALRAGVNYTLPDILSVGTRQSAMELELSTLRGDASISNLDFDQLGNATGYLLSVFDGNLPLAESRSTNISFDPAIMVNEGYGRLLTVMVTPGQSQDGSSFGLSLNSSGVNVSDEVTTTVDAVQSGAKVAYIESVPGTVVIDGAFGDWVNGYVVSDFAGDVVQKNGSLLADSSIDIQEYGMYTDGRDVAMYLSVEDNILNGTILPKGLDLPVPSSGLENLTKPEMLGTDVAGAVIDSDWDINTGVNVSGLLGADHLVLVTGKNGRVVSSELYAWNPAGNGTWELKDGVKAAVDRWHMEFAFNFSRLPLGDYDIAAVGFFMTDWKGGTDYSDSVLPLGKWQIGTYMKAFGGILINEVLNSKGGSDFIELYNTGTQPITLTGWRIYDGTTLIYTFGTVTINPGELYVVSGLSISKTGNLLITDQGGATIDAVAAKENANALSYARTGGLPYDKWKGNTPPTPGAVNPKQIPIPEFSDVMLPIIFICAFFLLMKRRRRRDLDARA